LDALSLFKFTANLLFLIAPWRSMELCYSRGNDCEVGEGFQSISLALGGFLLLHVYEYVESINIIRPSN